MNGENGAATARPRSQGRRRATCTPQAPLPCSAARATRRRRPQITRICRCPVCPFPLAHPLFFAFRGAGPRRRRTSNACTRGRDARGEQPAGPGAARGAGGGGRLARRGAGCRCPCGVARAPVGCFMARYSQIATNLGAKAWAGDASDGQRDLGPGRGAEPEFEPDDQPPASHGGRPRTRARKPTRLPNFSFLFPASSSSFFLLSSSSSFILLICAWA